MTTEPQKPETEVVPIIEPEDTTSPASSDLTHAELDNTPDALETTDANETTQPTEPQQTGLATGTSVVVTHRRSHKKLYLIIIAVLVLIGAGATLFFVRHKDKPAPQVPSPTKVTKSETSAALAPDLQKFVHPTTGEVWESSLQPVSSLGYFTDETADNPATYYKAGTLNGSVLYIGSLPEGGGSDIEVFKKAPNGSVSVLLYANGNEKQNADVINSAAQQYTKNVTVDTTTHLDSLTPPASFTLDNKQQLTVDDYAHIGDPASDSTNTDGTTHTTVKTYGTVSIVKIERKYSDTGLTAINYELHTAAHTAVTLHYTPISTTLTSYTWDNGVAVTATKDDTGEISPIIRGCGAALSAVSRADNVTDADFIATGKSSDGKTVYAFKNTNNPLVTKAYSEYKDGYAGDTYVTVVSFDEFLKNHGVLAYKDVNGQWLVYTRNLYSVGGGCAKPVVYLYPTHAENISVKVGADVKVSDPYYNPTTGWNVVAYPNGQLNLSGKTYDSLFWEGQGNGIYPGIINGTVVKHSDAIATIANQLKQQGLTTKETNDFLSYWTSKIPNKPYVRLTWFNTAQLNELAPLHINPQPDTVIRVFLDMDGFNTKISLPIQKLTSIPRKGFTVVEWGGLSGAKLQ